MTKGKPKPASPPQEGQLQPSNAETGIPQLCAVDVRVAAECAMLLKDWGKGQR